MFLRDVHGQSESFLRLFKTLVDTLETHNRDRHKCIYRNKDEIRCEVMKKRDAENRDRCEKKHREINRCRQIVTSAQIEKNERQRQRYNERPTRTQGRQRQRCRYRHKNRDTHERNIQGQRETQGKRERCTDRDITEREERQKTSLTMWI